MSTPVDQISSDLDNLIKQGAVPSATGIEGISNDLDLAAKGHQFSEPPVDADTAVNRLVHHAVSSVTTPVVGGLRQIGGLLTGKYGSYAEAEKDYSKYVRENTYQPPDVRSQELTKAYDQAATSPYNPMTWPGRVVGKGAELLGQGVNAALDPRHYSSSNLPTTGGPTDIGPLVAGGAQMALGAYPVVKPLLGESLQGVFSRPPPAAPVAPPAPQAGVPQDAAGRAEVLKRVGINETRKSALEANAQGAADDYQMSGLNSKGGQRMAQVIQGERNALESHADDLVTQTGGTHGMDQSTLVNRGETILNPLEELQNYFKNGIRKLYSAADERAKGQPVALEGFKGVMDDESLMTNQDSISLKSALGAYLKKVKVSGEDGSVAGTVQQAETVRKYLNDNWSPHNSRYVGALKDAMDEDVTKAAGMDIYEQARALRTLKAQTLDDPTGISRLLDSSGPAGMNRKVYPQQVPDAVTSMPLPQFKHVVDTLKNLPPELQDQGAAALSEIKAHMANRVVEAGRSTKSLWNSKGVDQVLQSNNARFDLMFTPEELQGFNDLSAAGKILAKDQSYRGAFVQGHNLSNIGALAVRGGGAVLGEIGGASLGAPGLGSAVGAGAAEAGIRAVGERAALKLANERIVPLK